MTFLPCVTPTTREHVSRELDEIGPDAATAQTIQLLEQDNPEILDMLSRSARDIGDTARTMAGFAMFYRLLLVEASLADQRMALALPRVSPETRTALVRKIDQQGEEAFVTEAIEGLERDNPELLQMAHGFAARHPEYLRVMQGFALMYQALAAQLSSDRLSMH
jgi:hypothetical protein